MKWLPLTLLLFLAACTASTSIPPLTSGGQSTATTSGDATSTLTGIPADLPDLGPAPELTNETWLNTDQPLRLAELRGKVVLIDMWTFG